eukprot:TRINITY_DN67633_c7_g2_i1.p1 TRINITY_DN67633_c7_g2~~TRINITY_DN67633_c7_g2_i1.p1  ORF type:complete len:1285 (-),score=179.01 TRINITY_DN67633_c7_g2_i1:801-4517(-)
MSVLLDNHAPKHIMRKAGSGRSAISLCCGLLDQLLFYVNRITPGLSRVGTRIREELMYYIFSEYKDKQEHEPPVDATGKKIQPADGTGALLGFNPPIHTLAGDAHGLERMAQRYVQHISGWGGLWQDQYTENENTVRALEYQLTEMKQAHKDAGKETSERDRQLERLKERVAELEKKETALKEEIIQMEANLRDSAAQSAPKLIEEVATLRQTVGNFMSPSVGVGDANTADMVKLRSSLLAFVSARIPPASSTHASDGRKEADWMKLPLGQQQIEEELLALVTNVLEVSIESSRKANTNVKDSELKACLLKNWTSGVHPDAYLRILHGLFPDILPSFQTQTALTEVSNEPKMGVIMSTMQKIGVPVPSSNEINSKQSTVHITLMLELMHKFAVTQSCRPTFIPASQDDHMIGVASTAYVHSLEATDASVPVKHICHQLDVVSKTCLKWLSLSNYLEQCMYVYSTAVFRKGGGASDDANSKELQSWLSEAQRMQTAGDPEAAIAAYDKAISVAPTHAPSHYRRGQAKAEAGDFEGARLDYVKATTLDHSWREGKHQGRELINPESTNVNAQMTPVEEESMARFQCGLDTHHIDSLIDQAKESDYETAIALVEEALKIDPVSAPAYYTLAELKHEHGDFEGARLDYVKGTTVDPNWRDGANDEKETAKEAAQAGEPVLNAAEKKEIEGFGFGINPDKEKVDALLSQAAALEAANDPEKALRIYDDAIANDDMNPTPYYRRGWLKHETGDFEGARLDYIKSTALDIEWREGRHEENAKDTMNAEAEPPDPTDDFMDGDFKLGTAAVVQFANEEEVEELIGNADAAREQGDAQAALEAYNQAIEAAPEQPKAIYRRGTLRHEMGDFEGARLDYIAATGCDTEWRDGQHKDRTDLKVEEKEVEKKHSNLEKYDWEGGYKDAVTDILKEADSLKNKDAGAALNALDQAVDMNPGYAPAYYKRGELKHEQGDFEGARLDYVTATRVDPEWRDGANAGRTDLDEEREDDKADKVAAFNVFDFGEKGEEPLSPSKVTFDWPQSDEPEPVLRSERVAPRGRRRSLWHDLNEAPEKQEWDKRVEEKEKAAKINPLTVPPSNEAPEAPKSARRARSTSVRRKSLAADTKTPRVRKRSISNSHMLEQKEAAKAKLDEALKHLPTIEFEPNKAILKSGEVSGLNAVAGILQEYPLVKLQVIGTTVNQDKMALAHRRAEACISYLVQKGITVTRLEPKGIFGDQKATLFEPIM